MARPPQAEGPRLPRGQSLSADHRRNLLSSPAPPRLCSAYSKAPTSFWSRAESWGLIR